MLHVKTKDNALKKVCSSGDGSMIRKQTLRAEDRRRDLGELKWMELTVKQKNNKYRGIQKTVLLLLF